MKAAFTRRAALGLRVVTALVLLVAPSGAAVRPVVNRDYLPALLELIEGAERSIEFLQLEYHDDRAMRRVEAALAAALARGVRVRGLLEDGIAFNDASRRRLLDLGAEVELDTPRKMLHAKLVVVDGKRVLLGSTNWTGNSMANNNETNVLLDDPDIVAAFEAYLAALCADSFKEPAIPSVESAGVKTLVNRQYIPEDLAMLESARVRIRVILYGINYNPKYEDSKVNRLVEALAAAAARGVDVAVVMDVSDYNHALNKVNAAARAFLAAAGVRVLDDPEKITTHAKMVLADDRVVIGSANWGFDAMERRNETSVVIREPEAVAFFMDYFDRPDVSGRGDE